jgi:tRNA threonylcarbamoyladenosine biosynthesis protein TsaB
LNKPLIAITSLQVLAKGMQEALPKNLEEENNLLCPMIDARRMEVYTAFFDMNLQPVGDVHAVIVDAESFQESLAEGHVVFAGNGAAKCSQVISHPHALFLEEVFPLAANMGSLVQIAYDAKRFEDVAYFEPFYLKDFIATIPRRKVL